MSTRTPSGTFSSLPTLAGRIEDAGPLPTADAVRLAARLCRNVEALHGKKQRHGALGPLAVRIDGEDLSKAVVTRPTPLQMRTSEDHDAIARLLHFALTGTETKPAERPAALGVFDVGDDALDALLARVWGDDATITTVAELRAELEGWLDEKVKSLPWDDRGFDAAIELAALPPPPAAPESVARRAPSNPRESFDFEEERPTLPGEVMKPAPAPRRPRLVPPKLSPSSQRGRARPTEADTTDEVQRTDAAPRRGRGLSFLLGAGATLAAVLAWQAMRGDDPAPPVPRSDAAQSIEPSASTSAPTAKAGPSASIRPSSAPADTASGSVSALVTTSSGFASASATPSSSAAPSASASVSPSLSADARAAAEASQRCLATALPADTFAGTFTDLTSICAQEDAVQGAQDLRLMIVRAGAGRPVTAGMKEWSLLGMYELPAFAILRGRCCGKQTVNVPSSPDGCPTTVASALKGLAATDLSSKKAVDQAIEALDRAFRCVQRSGADKRFGGYNALSGGEVTPFRKILARLPARAP